MVDVHALGRLSPTYRNSCGARMFRSIDFVQNRLEPRGEFPRTERGYPKRRGI